MAGFFSKGDKQNQWPAKAEQAFEKGLFEEASELYTKAADAEPTNAHLWMRLATALKYCGKHDAAARAYTKAVAINPDEGQAWIHLALYYGEKGMFEEALSAISHVVISATEPYLLERKCEWLERMGKYADAAALSASLTSPTNKTYRLKTADLLLRAGKFSEARDIYDELSRTFDGNTKEYAAAAGLCSELMGDVDSALYRYQNADEEDILALYRRARLEEAAGNFKEAAASYAKIQQGLVSDDVSIAVRRTFALFWSGSTKEAASQLEKIISRANSSPDLWYLLGTISFMNGSLNRAIEAFDTVIRIGQPPASVWYMKGASEFLVGKYQDAIDSFEKTSRMTGMSSVVKSSMFNEDEMELFATSEQAPAKVEFSSVNEGLLSMEAVSLSALGRYAEADKAARTVLDANPNRADMELIRLRCLAGQGKYKNSEDAFARVSAKMPDDYTLLFEHAQNQMSRGEYRAAAETWENLLSFCPGNTLIYSRLVQSVAASGNYSDAKKVADTLLADVPHDILSLTAAAEASFAAGDYADAEGYYLSAAEHQPENPAIQAGLGSALFMQGRFTEAKSAYAKAVEKSEDAIGISLAQAKAAADGGDTDEAISLYMDVLNSRPDILGVAGEVARLAYAAHRFTDAADAAAYAVSQNTADFHLLCLGGDACMACDRVDEAISYYTQAAEMKPDNIAVVSSLANAHLARGEYREALTRLKVVTSAGENPKALYEKAVCEANIGQLDAAEATLLHLCDIDEENQVALLLLADLYERKGEYDSVLETYGRYLTLNAENVDVFRKAAAIYRMRGETEEALNGYEMILERCPNDFITLRFKAEALFALGEYRAAADVCAAVLEHGEDDAVHLLYAEALANAGDSETAQAEYAAILKNGSESFSAYLAYADLLSRNGDYARAETAYTRILQKFPKNERAYLERSMNAMKTGNMEGFLTSLKEAAMAFPKNPYVLAGVAYLYSASGHPNDALAFFDKAENAGCKDADLYCCRAVIYLSQSRFDLAERAASEVLKRRPSNKTALHIKAKALEGLGQIREAVSLYNQMLDADEYDEEEEIPLPQAEEKEKKPEPKKSYSSDEGGYGGYGSYGEQREKSGYRDMIIN